MDGDKTAQNNCLRISSQRIEELWGLKDERVVVGMSVVGTEVRMEVRRRIQANGLKRLTKQVP